MAVFMKEKIADILTECQHTPGLQSFTSKPDEMTIEEDPLFLDGYSSFIVRLRAGDGSTVIAKHAPPYVREFGESMPYSEKRAELEMTGLQLFERYIPGSVAKPFYFSRKHNTTLMEDLAGYKILQSELIAGNVNNLKAVIGSLAVYMATLHRSTHKDNISKLEWTNLEDIFDKFLPLRERILHILTTYHYIHDPQDDVAKQLKHIADSRVFGDSKMSQCLDQFSQEFIHGSECLIHGDAHSQNILVKGEDVKMTDLELVRLGKGSMDVALLFADLLCPYYHHLVSPDDAEHHRQIAHKIRECTYHLVNTYIEHMSWSSGDHVTVTQFMKEFSVAVGGVLFTCIAMGFRRYLGASQIPLFEAGIRLMEQHHVVDSVDKIYSILALVQE